MLVCLRVCILCDKGTSITFHIRYTEFVLLHFIRSGSISADEVRAVCKANQVQIEEKELEELMAK